MRLCTRFPDTEPGTRLAVDTLKEQGKFINELTALILPGYLHKAIGCL